jgi:hypothetical protein
MPRDRTTGPAVAFVAVMATLLGVCVRALPEVAGVLFVSYGVYLAYRPAGFAVLGVFVLLAARRIPE